MYNQSVTFEDTSSSVYPINRMTAASSLVGTELVFTPPSEEGLAEITALLSTAEVRFKVLFESTIQVKASTFDTRVIFRCLEALKNGEKISNELFSDVVENYPSGWRGTINLTPDPQGLAVSSFLSDHNYQFLEVQAPWSQPSRVQRSLYSGLSYSAQLHVEASVEPSVEIADNEQGDEELEKYEDQIPSKYKCPLSCSRMLKPVYDPRHPQIIYEEQNIVRWLTGDGHYKNPYTREFLAPTELKSANLLQLEIEEFVDALSEKNTKPAQRQKIPIHALLKNNALFSKLEDDFVTEHRHEDARLQQEYDERHGLVLI